MAIARESKARQTKPERIREHIEDLKRTILESFPDAAFEVGPVPESRWPGLWVHCGADLISDVTDPLWLLREEFFRRERMDVHVIVLGESESPGGGPD